MITNKWALLLEGRICAFLRREREFGKLLSSQWIKVLFPTAVAHHNNRGRAREREILEEDGLHHSWLVYCAQLLHILDPKPILSFAQ